jgi:hypothetical protein
MGVPKGSELLTRGVHHHVLADLPNIALQRVIEPATERDQQFLSSKGVRHQVSESISIWRVRYGAGSPLRRKLGHYSNGVRVGAAQQRPQGSRREKVPITLNEQVQVQQHRFAELEIRGREGPAAGVVPVRLTCVDNPRSLAVDNSSHVQCRARNVHAW